MANFQKGMVQYVRRPHGVPSSILPPKFQLGAAVYGHPLSNKAWNDEFEKTLSEISFEKLFTADSVYVKHTTATSDKVMCVNSTDDSLFAAPFNSPMKPFVNEHLAKHYQMTTEDPGDENTSTLNYRGMQLTRNRKQRTIEILLPGFMDQMVTKYPLPPGETYPTCPLSYTTSLSKQELADKKIPFTQPDEIKQFQRVLGDLIWIIMHVKPNLKFAHNVCARTISPDPTLYDYKRALRVMHYAISTKDQPRILGGPHGCIMTATVDSSFASFPDRKGQSCHTLHIGGGGAFIFDTTKQTGTPGSSAESEVYGAGEADKPIKWARNFLTEMEYDQSKYIPQGTPLGQDNTSAITILSRDSVSGSTKHIDLKYKIARESRKNKLVQDFYLPTQDMPADIGTKALTPGVFDHLSAYVLGHIPLPHFLKFFSST